MKRVWTALLTVFVWATISGAAQAAEQLQGLYFGIDDAAGASIRIEPDSQGFTGTFFDRNGNSQSFEADRIEDAAEAVLDMDGQAVLLRMAPLPFGAQVSLIPFNAAGNLELEFARSLGFLREGVNLPAVPTDFVKAPLEGCTRIAGNSFLASYQFWEPSGVVNGYLCLPVRFRTLMRMFPAVQLDVIWKLCLAPQADQALAFALKNQGVDCSGVRAGIATAQRKGRFDQYKGEVTTERNSLKTSVRCADGYVESKETCEVASRTLKENAVSLRTARMVLDRYAR